MTNVAVVSGGMDSITMLYHLHDIDPDVKVLSFNYGQKHKKELDFVQFHVDNLGSLDWKVIDLSSISQLLTKSALVGDRDVPEGHYEAESMKQTVVPNRNMIMASIAAAACINEGGWLLGLGVHAGDHHIYPDCRESFIQSLEATLKIANEGFIHQQFQIFAPWVHVPKQEIARIGRERYNIDYTETWSCYKGGELHCGKCGTCVERKEAFFLAKLFDPTEYEGTGIGGHYVDQNGAPCSFETAMENVHHMVSMQKTVAQVPPSGMYATHIPYPIVDPEEI